MDVSIIIVNYNTFQLTQKCIESVIQFVKGISYEIILIDNASVERNAEDFKQLFPQIHLIKSPENVGFAKGNNLGIKKAQGKYILLLNSDTELVDNALAICLEKMQTDKEIGVISPQLIYPDGKIQHVANRFPSPKLELIELFRIQKLFGKKYKADLLLGFFFDHHTEKEVDWVWGAFFLTRKEIIDQFPEGKLSDDFFMYFEDVQWCYQIKQMGFKILYFPKTKVIHHLSASTQISDFKTKNWRKVQKNAENESHFFVQTKGVFYTKILYLLRALKYSTLRKGEFRGLASFYFRFVWNGLKIKS